MGFSGVNGQVHEDELIMGLTEKECRSALLLLASAVESLTGDEEDDDVGPNRVQAAIAEDAARAAIRVVLAQTRGIAEPGPALEVAPRGNFLTDLEVHRRRLRSVRPRSGPDLPDIIA